MVRSRSSAWIIPASSARVGAAPGGTPRISAARGARQGLAVVGDEQRRGLGREELRVGAAEDLLARRPKDAEGGAVGVHVTAVERLDPRQARQVLHEARELLLAAAQLLDGAF